MFIVAMTIALLAALGAYALTVAAAEVRTSGYLRQSVQSHYLSEWAVLGATEELALNGQVQEGCSLNPQSCPWPGAPVPPIPTPPQLACPSLALVPNLGTGTPVVTPMVAACRVLTPVELVTPPTAHQWMPLNAPANPPITPWTAAATPGDFGMNTNPTFMVELTDPYPLGPPKGTGTGIGTCNYMLTVTAYGFTMAGATTTDSEGVETARAKVAFGPIYDPGNCK